MRHLRWLPFFCLFSSLCMGAGFGTTFGALEEQKRAGMKALEKRSAKKLDGRPISFLGFGGIEVGRAWAIGQGKERDHPNAAIAKKSISTAFEAGLTSFDTASAYHLSEERFAALSALIKDRDVYLINTKAGEHSIPAANAACKRQAYDGRYCEQPASYYDFSESALRASVQNSLEKLNIDTIDTLFLHFGGDVEKVLDAGVAVSTLQALRAEGKIRYLGASTDGAAAKRCIDMGVFDAIELEYSLLNRQNEENIALAHAQGMAVFVRGGLGTGLLTERVAAYRSLENLPFKAELDTLLTLVNGDLTKLRALALAFLYQNRGITSVVVGTRYSDHIAENIQALDDFADHTLLLAAIKATEAFHFDRYTYSVDAFFRKLERH